MTDTDTTQTPHAFARPAVIYCRVSDSKQRTVGDGLNSQEARCREYAERKGYTVAAVFHGDITGKSAVRPAFEAMQSFVRKNRKHEPIVLIDDISRFARNIEAHWHLGRSLKEAGGTLESPTIEFDDDPDAVLIENMLASVAQHHRQKNGEQAKAIRQEMKAQIRKIDKDLSTFMDRIVAATNASVIKAYESRICELEI
ncbi:MAG: recombinase family protein [Pseudomonadota bacterium]